MNHKNNLEEIMFGQVPSKRIETATLQVNQHKIRLNCSIDEPEAFNDELNLIENMSEHDSCTIILNSGGGYLSTAIEFISAIAETQGHIHCHVAGSAHSAASLIFLQGHSFSVSDNADILIHIGDMVTGGKTSDVFSQGEHDRKRYVKLFNTVYRDFLTPEEIDGVLRGNDIWLDADDINERLERMVEIRNKRAEEESKAFIENEQAYCGGCNNTCGDSVPDMSGYKFKLSNTVKIVDPLSPLKDRQGVVVDVTESGDYIVYFEKEDEIITFKEDALELV